MDEILKNEERIGFYLRRLYSSYGYQPFKMSRFEEYDLYVRNKDFLLSDQVITFADRSGRLLALKPDVTLSIIKNVRDVPGLVQRFYYNENVFRMDKGTQCFKEILQTGLECVGDLTIVEAAEVALLAAQSLAQIGQDFVLDISHMGLLNAIVEDSGLQKESRKTVMTLLHQKNTHEMRALCERNGCDEKLTALLTALTCLSGNKKEAIAVLNKMLFTPRQKDLLLELEQICAVLTEQGYERNVHIDFSAGSQMKYYSGIVFCGYLQGIPDVVLSGGQYDTLLQKMHKRSRAIGFAIYLDLLKYKQPQRSAFDVDTILLYDGNDDISIVLRVAQELRKNGSVQIAANVPAEITYRNLMKLQDGEAVLLA